MKLLKVTLMLILLAMLSSNVFAQQQVKPADWKGFQFLIGKWVGEGKGQPGQGSGYFTFSFDLQKRVLVRKSHTTFPKTKERPASSHDDIMIVYQDNGKTKAVYFDNEGHQINYTAEFAKDSSSISFVSDIIPNSPRFRLVYEKLPNGKINNKFEIASPNKPEEFSKYIEGVVKKSK